MSGKCMITVAFTQDQWTALEAFIKLMREPLEQGVPITHWDGCWRGHHECAVAMIEQLQGHLAAAQHRFESAQLRNVERGVALDEIGDRVIEALGGSEKESGK